MSDLNTNEKQLLEKLLHMSSGYVLDFSDRTIAEFFRDNLRVDFYDDKYNYGSGSKANRMRGFWLKATNELVGQSILELLEYIENKILMEELEENEFSEKLILKADQIANRLSGGQSVQKKPKTGLSEHEFLQKEFKQISLSSLPLDSPIQKILAARIEEIRKCLGSGAPLSVVFLCGSTLEGILLGVAISHPAVFNSAKAAPQHEGRTKQFQKWTLANFIDVGCELKLLEEDVKKHSHTLRDFRNYIHPYQQLSTGFNPHSHTALISWQVLQAGIYEIGKNLIKIK